MKGTHTGILLAWVLFVLKQLNSDMLPNRARDSSGPEEGASRSALITVTKDFKLPDGIVLPVYSKAIIIANGADAALIGVDYSGNLIVAFRNGGKWTRARKL